MEGPGRVDVVVLLREALCRLFPQAGEKSVALRHVLGDTPAFLNDTGSSRAFYGIGLPRTPLLANGPEALGTARQKEIENRSSAMLCYKPVRGTGYSLLPSNL